MRLVIIIAVILFVENSEQRVQFDKEETISPVLSRFVNAALSRYYEETLNLLVFASNPEMLGGISPPVPCLLFKDWDALTKIMSEMIYTLIVFLDGKAADGGLDDAERLQGLRTRKPILIVCEGAAACGSKVYLEKIASVTNTPLLHYVFADEGGSVRIFRRTTTAEGSCGVPRLVRITYDESKTWPNDETFYMSVNFNQCSIRLSTYYIHTISMPCKPGDLNHFCGEEGSIVKIFVDKINATAVTIPAKNFREVVDNLVMERADLVYGYSYALINESFVMSDPYLFCKIVIAVPHSAAKPETSFWAIAQPLELKVWIGIAVVIITILILGRTISNFRSINALHQLSLILGISVPSQPRQFPQRIYFFSIVFFGFVISQSYLVHLTKIYAAPSLNYIKTLDQLEKSGISIHGGPHGKELLAENGYTRIAQNYKLVDIKTHTEIVFAMLEGKSAIPSYFERDPEIIAKYVHIEVMEEIALWRSLGMYASNSNGFMKALNRVIAAVTESKISDTRIYSESNYKEFTPNETYRGPKKLSFEDVWRVFLLLGVCLALSTSVFVVEFTLGFIKRNSLSAPERWAMSPVRRS